MPRRVNAALMSLLGQHESGIHTVSAGPES